MYTKKTPAITAEIERRIRSTVYAGRLPVTSVLQQEFHVARQTVTEALRPLVDRGVLIPSRRNGMRIEPSHLLNGKILLVFRNSSSPDNSRGDVDMLHAELAATAEQIRADGLTPEFINAPRVAGRQVHLPSDVCGILFGNSTLTVDLAEAMDNGGIPFVSCNQLPSCPRLNVIGYDNRESLQQLLESGVAAGYRRIGMFYSGRLEGFNEKSRANLLWLKRRLGLPHEPYDDISANWRDTITHNFQKMLGCMRDMNSFPELLLMLCSLPETEARMLENFPPAASGAMHVVSQAPSDGTSFWPRGTVFTNGSTVSDYFCAGYQLLREVMLDSKPVEHKNRIRRIFRSRIVFNSALPTVSDGNTKK